jgi:hypothetical protein
MGNFMHNLLQIICGRVNRIRPDDDKAEKIETACRSNVNAFVFTGEQNHVADFNELIIETRSHGLENVDTPRSFLEFMCTGSNLVRGVADTNRTLRMEGKFAPDKAHRLVGRRLHTNTAMNPEAPRSCGGDQLSRMWVERASWILHFGKYFGSSWGWQFKSQPLGAPTIRRKPCSLLFAVSLVHFCIGNHGGEAHLALAAQQLGRIELEFGFHGDLPFVNSPSLL